MELLDRLRRADAELQLVDAFLTDTSAAVSLPPQLRSRAAERFSHVALRKRRRRDRVAGGRGAGFRRGAAAGSRRPGCGAHRAHRSVATGMHPQVVLRRASHARPGDELIAVLADEFLWDHGLVPPWVSFVALGQGKLPLSPVLEEFGSQLPAGFDAVAEAGVGQFEWQRQGEYRWSADWSVGLRADFLTSPWTLVVSQPRQDALAPIASAGSTIGYVSGASLLAVMLLSLVQVRRNLVPLTCLQEGTRRLGQGDFDHDVNLTSGDEFEELAQSFNGMAHRLKRQFHTLSARGELDRAVLSSLDDGAIIRTLLEHLPQLVDCDHVAVMYADRDAGLDMRLFWRSARAGSIGESEVSSVGTDLHALSARRGHRTGSAERHAVLSRSAAPHPLGDVRPRADRARDAAGGRPDRRRLRAPEPSAGRPPANAPAGRPAGRSLVQRRSRPGARSTERRHDQCSRPNGRRQVAVDGRTLAARHGNGRRHRRRNGVARRCPRHDRARGAVARHRENRGAQRSLEQSRVASLRRSWSCSRSTRPPARGFWSRITECPAGSSPSCCSITSGSTGAAIHARPGRRSDQPRGTGGRAWRTSGTP